MVRLLGIDLGTSGVKCVVIDDKGLVLSTASCRYPTQYPQPGWAEQNPDDWWGAASRCVKECIGRLADQHTEIDAIGFSGHMSGLVIVDKEGLPLRPCILLSDGRSAKESEDLGSEFGDYVLRATGNPVVDAFVAPKLLWVRRNEPEIYSKAVAFLFPKDYVRLKLTGRICSEPTDAGNSLFLRRVSSDIGWGWDNRLVSDMGFDAGILPPLVSSTDIVGRVSSDAAKATGLRAGTPVIAGAADMACSAMGTGAVRPGVAAITIGTLAQTVTCIEQPSKHGHGKVTFHPHVVKGLMYSMGSILTGGLGIGWIAKILAGNSGVVLKPEDISAIAQDASAGSHGLIFLPFLLGSGSPRFDPDFSGAWIGLTSLSTQADVARSVMEGVAFNIKESLDVFRVMGIGLSRINVGGGGAASDVWRQILADVVNQPVFRTKTRDAATAGAAALAGVGVGVFNDAVDASDTIVSTEPDAAPCPGSAQAYERLYEIYMDGQDALASIFRRLADFRRDDS